jgi:hypothetical protein
MERVQQVTLTQHGREYLQEVQVEGGKKWEYWSLNTAELYGNGGTGSLMLRPAKGKHPGRLTPRLHREESANDSPAPESARLPEGNAAHEDYHSLQALRWIRQEHYKTTLEIDGQQVLVFLLPPEAPPKAEPRGKNSHYRSPLGGLPMRPGITAAGIHAGTRLPAFLQKDNEWRVYEFTPLRSERLFYPQRVTRFLESLAPAPKTGPKPLP